MEKLITRKEAAEILGISIKIGSDYFLCWSFSIQNQIPCAGSFGCQRIHVILKAR